MPQVVIEQPNVPPMTLPLSDSTIQFGRAEDNDVVLVADEVSRHHAKMCYHDGRMVLMDLKSMNGTYVNRQRVVERVLSHLDEIWFGSKCRLVYRDDTAFGRRTMPAEQETKRESRLQQDVDKIRAEMDRVGQSLTIIAKRGRTPAAIAETATLPGQVTPPPRDLLAMSRAYRRLAALYDVLKVMASDFDLTKRMADVLDKTMTLMEAERGFLLLRDEASGELRVSVAREMGQDLEASSPSMGIAGKAAIDGEPVLMASSADDEDLGRRASIIQQRIMSAMAVPLKLEDRTLGSIYIDTRKPGVVFNEEDIELFASLAAPSAMAIDNVRLYEQMLEGEKKRANLSRFLAPAIVDQVLKEDSVLELGGAKQEVTTVFCDIRGFTPIAERMSPDTLVELLNEHFTAMNEIVFRFQGTLDKYLGDGLMAVFGAPLSSGDDAANAVRAALAFQARNAELNKDRAEDGRPELHLGAGITTGDVVAGCVGSPDRMDFTVIGDHVNTASRLCDIAEGGQVVVDARTHELIGDRAEARSIGSVKLKGKADAVEAFEVVGMR